eukprot:CAMPEP_0196580572 /NCGR_PEP_ID=MMETSP1081-20130531/29401_1 /TAXON_ID=36882 /ORGANISM="Pyramimonas amylifera, Strain CCMP720" /LENGTH=192 /DNA_ID=CAMNT_0041900475 /DNA_START=60 /DNA_END=638 /DNA_ORIENTATION=+
MNSKITSRMSCYNASILRQDRSFLSIHPSRPFSTRSQGTFYTSRNLSWASRKCFSIISPNEKKTNPRSLINFASVESQESSEIPIGCRRYNVSLKKPLGLILEERENGEIYVAEIVPESNSAKTEKISVGDTLISTTAIVFTTEAEYGEVTVKGGETRVTLPCRGESFETIMRAIGTHKGQLEVKLEFQKCD